MYSGSSDPERLPPTTGAFFQHALPSFLQANICAQAEKPFIDNLNPTKFGWDTVDNCYVPVGTAEPVSPSSIIELLT